MNPRGVQGPIQRPFAGLLGLLDLKGSEVAPNSMAGYMQPVIDTESYLVAGTLRNVQEAGVLTPLSATASFQNTTVPLEVPAGKVWLVRSATLLLNIPVGDAIADVGISKIPNATATGGLQLLALVLGPFSPSVGVLVMVSFQPARPLVCVAGNRFGIAYSDNNVTANRAFTIALELSEVNA